LIGTAADPDNNPMTYLWSKVSGGSATITSPTSLITTITNLTQGTYTFWLTATDSGGLSNADSVTITVNPAPIVNTPPTANAGADQTITLPTNSVTLSGAGTDTDGSITSYVWTKVQGGTATITSPTSASTTVTGLSQGSYDFRLTVSDNSGATAYDDVIVTVNYSQVSGTPVVTLYKDCSYGGYSIPLSVGSYHLTQLLTLGMINDDISSVQITPGYQATLYQDDLSGSSLTLTANDSCFVNDNFNDVMSSIVVAPSAPLDTTPPTISFSAPSNGATISGTVTLSATATDNVGVVRVDFASGSTTIVSDTTSPYTTTLDTTSLPNGSYTFTATVYDAAGNSGTTAVTVTVSNQAAPVTGPLINVSQASLDSGDAYIVNQNFGVPADSISNLTASPLRIFENGKELSPAHAAHADIRTYGAGRFSHWTDGTNTALYFSSSDNTDPRTNGRTYTYLTSTGTTPPPSTSSPVATFYRDCNYGGTAVSLPVGTYNFTSTLAAGIANDSISSVVLTPGYQATLYQDDLSGSSLTLTANDSCFVNDNFNDVMSSVIIAPISTTPPSSTIAVGSRVAATTTVWVRSSPSTRATRLGYQRKGATGSVIGGPTSANGYTWWQVNFDSGADGWVAGNYLVVK
ncbi:MAG TPA: Ig-like domain-containing protein, partial [Candidatus Paceibacterota bacterium]|nr:Ig-like domain-containing protein [Candidatus Paceibacterota bacterium]